LTYGINFFIVLRGRNIRGDFTEIEVYEALLALTKGKKVDTVLSDIAPNMSGQLSVDIPKSMYLWRSFFLTYGINFFIVLRGRNIRIPNLFTLIL
jgi:hypothetical protein